MRLADYLQGQDITKSEFAKQINISAAHMSDICNGKKNPSLPLARRIIGVTEGKVTVGDLFHPEAPTRLKEIKKKTE